MPSPQDHTKKTLSSGSIMPASQSVTSRAPTEGSSLRVSSNRGEQHQGDGPEHSPPGNTFMASQDIGSASAPHNMDIQDKTVKHVLQQKLMAATPEHFQIGCASSSNAGSSANSSNSLSPVFGASSVDDYVPTENGCDSTNSEYSAWDKPSANSRSPHHGVALRSGASENGSQHSLRSFELLSSVAASSNDTSRDDGSSVESQAERANLAAGVDDHISNSMQENKALRDLPAHDEGNFVKQSLSSVQSSKTPVDSDLAKGKPANCKMVAEQGVSTLCSVVPKDNVGQLSDRKKVGISSEDASLEDRDKVFFLSTWSYGGAWEEPT